MCQYARITEYASRLHACAATTHMCVSSKMEVSEQDMTSPAASLAVKLAKPQQNGKVLQPLSFCQMQPD